jgi:glycine/D-amino acid oxidase-like deaminating enzyme
MGSRKCMVICGGGAIGAAIAYFISRRDARPIVIERHEVAGAASGKSGGFLALDWCRGGPLDRLARRSFELHAQLSSEGDPWGYRRLTTYSGYAAEGDTARGLGGRPWLAGGVTITDRLGSTESTAVVEPRAFTTGLMRAAQEHGAVLRHGTVVDLVRRPSGAVRGVALASGEIVEGDAVVIAMGPWSILAPRWLPLPAVLSCEGHSLVFETGGAIPAEAPLGPGPQALLRTVRRMLYTPSSAGAIQPGARWPGCGICAACVHGAGETKPARDDVPAATRGECQAETARGDTARRSCRPARRSRSTRPTSSTCRRTRPLLFFG